MSFQDQCHPAAPQQHLRYLPVILHVCQVRVKLRVAEGAHKVLHSHQHVVV